MGTIIRNESEGEYRNGRNKRHQGHRQRMRERVQNYGLDSLAEHEALEYVLYLTNAQKDTNGIAHDLIDRFGDFCGGAGSQRGKELCTVEGVGPGHSLSDAASAAADLPLLQPQPNQHHRCIKTYRTDGQLPHGKVCMVGLRGAPCW